ncbi:MAG: serine/threonine protein kinase, partial [Acidimicrobiia bacterium]|nr:serine/threonine protein kinase [Acidimicrobiia bacterium]
MAGHTRDIARFAGAVLIGRGGFGSVYRATDVEHGRDVAIKVLQGALGDTERRRFDRERQTMGRLGAHPNIIPVHESGYTDQGEAYLVMELAAHGSLRDRLDRDGTIPWQEAVSIITAIAGATQAAHEQGVLHRDIKPDNILIDAYHNPRLGDFGIAAVASNATATTSTTATLAHAAPEILQGAPSTAAADIYAIGSTLYNLMTGWPPFQRPGDENVTALITRALTEPPPDLRVHGVPDSVARVVERALAKDIGARQASAAQLAQELVEAAANPSAPPLGASPMPIVSNSETIISSPPMHAGHQGAADTPQRSIPAAGAGTGAAAAAAARHGVADGVTIISPPQPSPQFSPPAAHHAGASAPHGHAGASAPHGYAATARPGSGRLWWIVAAVAFIALAGAAGAFAATRSGSGNATGGGAIAGGGTTEPTIDTTTSSDPAPQATTSTSSTVASTTTTAPT